MSAVALKSEFVGKKKVCPVCGEKMHHSAKTCGNCLRNQAKGVIQAARSAQTGVQTARQIREELPEWQAIFEPTLAQVRVTPKAKIMQVGKGEGAKDTLKDIRQVSGGFMEVFFFGSISQAMADTIVTGTVELKKNPAGKFYVRVEVVPGVRSDARLDIRPGRNLDGLVENLPKGYRAWSVRISETGEQKELDATIGFVAV